MVLWVLGICFFAVTFGPRFFAMMNFSYGFMDLGLYTQFFSDLTQGFFNPYIPTLKQTFFSIRPQPLMLLLWLLSFTTTHPAIFLFLDEAAIISAAAVCANFTWRKTHDSAIAIAIFAIILFSPLLIESLHGAAVIEIWAQPFLALLFTEYFSRRRPFYMTLWFILLCMVNLNFCVLGILLIPFSLLTQRSRWKFKRRTEVALPLALAALVCLALLHYFRGEIQFGTEFFWTILGAGIIKLLLSFWFIPMLVPEVVLFGFLLLIINLNGGHPSPTLLVTLGALGTIVFFERLKLPTRFKVHQILATALIASCVYYNLINRDPFFGFWKPDRWVISAENKKVHDMINHIPPLDTLAASDVFTPLLGNRLSLITLSSVNWHGGELPRYILSRNEAMAYPQFSKIEENVKTGTRLFVRFK